MSYQALETKYTHVCRKTGKRQAWSEQHGITPQGMTSTFSPICAYCLCWPIVQSQKVITVKDHHDID